MKPLVKWPGGKSSEIRLLSNYLPKYTRGGDYTYVSPFVGGGALYFHLKPPSAWINDTDNILMDFYSAVKRKDTHFFQTLNKMVADWEILSDLSEQYSEVFRKAITDGNNIIDLAKSLSQELEDVLPPEYSDYLFQSLQLKRKRLEKLIMSQTSLKLNSERDNLESAIKGAYYTFIRDEIFNRKKTPAHFFFIREFCFGSMFRYNSQMKFNIPYGGINYNRKNFRKKVQLLTSPEVGKLMETTNLSCNDFEDFLRGVLDKIEGKGFVFLDPPYDTEFSKYSGVSFTKDDHVRLANMFAELEIDGMLVIKETDFITKLYRAQKNLNIHRYNKKYTYNVRGRNERDVTHLVITNY